MHAAFARDLIGSDCVLQTRNDLTTALSLSLSVPLVRFIKLSRLSSSFDEFETRDRKDLLLANSISFARVL